MTILVRPVHLLYSQHNIISSFLFYCTNITAHSTVLTFCVDMLVLLLQLLLLLLLLLLHFLA